jgi:hypothetical protein
MCCATSASTVSAAQVPHIEKSQGTTLATQVRWHGHGHWGGGWGWRGPRIFIGPAYYGYGYGYPYSYGATYPGYYGGDCAWLRHRARVTGSPYWWRRYHWRCG